MHPGIGFTCNRRSHDIHHAKSKRSTLPRLTQPPQSVGGFTRLAYRNHHRAFFNNGVAIPELTGIGGLSGNAAPMFDQLSADHGRMQRRALPQQHHPTGLHQLACVIGQTAQDHLTSA